MTLVEDTDLAYNWLKSLLTTGAAEIILQPRFDQEKKLWHFFNEQRAAQRLEGRQVLYFTYPYLLRKEAGQLNRIPLLRWPCILEPPVNNRPHWVLKTYVGTAGESNGKVVAALSTTAPNDWEKLLEAALQPSTEALQQLGLFAQALAEKTEYCSSSWQPALAQMPQIEIDPEGAGELWWSARLVVDTSHWRNNGDLPVHFHEPFTHEESAIGNLALSRLAPAQYYFFKQVLGQRYALAEGNPESGLSSISAELLKLSLAQGKSCLIVSRKKANLEALYQQLDKITALNGYGLLWQDPLLDLPILKGLIASFDKNKTTPATYDPLRWRTTLSRCNRLQRQYDAWYEASRKKIFGDKSWSDLLGFYLYYARAEGKELLASQLNASQYSFTPREYQEISKALLATKPLYEAIGTLHHPLSNLSAAIFIHQDLRESQEFIATTSQKLLAQARKLHQRYVRIQSQYADQLAGFHEQRYLQLRNLFERLEQRLEDSHNAFGADTLRSGDRTLKIYGRFSNKYQKALEEKNALQADYEALKDLHTQLDPFPFDWPKQKPRQLLDKLAPLLISFRETLDNWRNYLFQGIQEEMVRLNFKTAIADLDASSGIELLERDLEVFIDEVNASGLYQLPLQSKTLTLPRQQKNLEEIIDQLERSQEGLLQYEGFYNWQRNWFSLSEISRKTIQAILRSRPKDWEASFSSWYFNEGLQKHYTPFSPLGSAAKEKYIQEVEQLRAQLPGFIQYEWTNRRNKAQQQLKSALKTWPESLGVLMQEYGEQFVNAYPISFANPEVAAELVPYYDLVVLEKAQDLSRSEAETLLSRAKQLAVVADTNQLTLSEQGVVTYLKQGNIPTVFCADDRVPNLAEKWSSRQPQVFFHQVDGRFSEQDQINEVEAQEVLKLLNAIEKQGLKTFPRVGIITLTATQRDLVQQLLFRIKKERSPGAELVQQLERNGLTVLQAADAMSQQFEVIIYTPVYGPVDYKGHLSSLLPRLNQGRELASLEVLQQVFSQAQTIHVLNSLPLDEIAVRQSWSDRPGEQLQTLMIGLAHAVSTQDYGEIDRLRQQWPISIPQQPASDSLARELTYRLKAQLPGWEWRFTRVRGIEVKVLLATAPTGDEIILLTDGFIAQGTVTTIDWENWQKDRLRLSGYRLLSFSSEELWKNPGLTCHRLASQLAGLATSGEEEE
ncbi:hypothetical protein [Lewinella sp. LCG006]|uniref:hypothetical protein n=1 Tax=Lewinella sp. LCG006 TaxID=3231911 RepID=UPI00345F55DD